MENGKYIGLIKESLSHTPMQGAPASVSPAATDLNHFPVLEALTTGKTNAITSQQLCAYLGFDSVRELQKEIARERAAGAVIPSTCQDSGGYFLPESTGELQEFIRTLESRGRNTLSTLHSARNLLRQQERPDGGGD